MKYGYKIDENRLDGYGHGNYLLNFLSKYQLNGIDWMNSMESLKSQ